MGPPFWANGTSSGLCNPSSLPPASFFGEVRGMRWSSGCGTPAGGGVGVQQGCSHSSLTVAACLLEEMRLGLWHIQTDQTGPLCCRISPVLGLQSRINWGSFMVVVTKLILIHRNLS